MRTGIWILGSCVTRDALHEESGDVDVEAYWARTSLGSAFSKKVFGGVDLDKINSPFQRRMVEADIHKLLPALVRDAHPDLFLVDFVDERFDLYEAADGSVCTLSNELLSSGFVPEGGRVIASGSNEFYSLWEQGWRTLISMLRERGELHKLRLHKAYWSQLKEDGTGFPTYPDESIRVANRFLDRLYARALEDVPPGQTIQCSTELIQGAIEHRWGASPFHYVTPYYRAFMRQLRGTLSPTSTDAPSSLSRAAVEVIKPSIPALVLSDLDLSTEPKWLDLRAFAGRTVRVCATVEGGPGISERRALVSMDFGAEHAIDTEQLGLMHSHDPKVGLYRYLLTGPGAQETRFSLELPNDSPALRLGIRSWWPESWVRLTRLAVAEAHPSPSTTLLSVDVEAIPLRSNGNAVEELIFGNIAGAQGRGITRICDIFADFGVRATFFVDYAACAVHGDSGIFRAAEYLRGRGHDVQLHMHPEVLIRHLKWHPHAVFFDELDVRLAHRVIDYGIKKFEQNLGLRPKILRPGAMKTSKALCIAAQQLGLEATSSVFRGNNSKHWPAFGQSCVVRWSNGVYEIPLDVALDPLQPWDVFESKVQAFRKERETGSVSLLLHSTSLLYRERSERAFTHFHQPYEAQLIRYLEQLAPKTRFTTHSDALDEANAHTAIPIDWAGAEPIVVRAWDDSTPASEFDSPALLIPGSRDAPSTVDACAPPTALPVRLAQGQSLHSLDFGEGTTGGTIGYIVAGAKAYLISQRASLPTGSTLRQLLRTVFDRHPMVSKIIAHWVLNDFSELPELSPTVIRKTFVLELPESFERYRMEFISRELRRDIEREERRANEELSGVRFEILQGKSLTAEALSEAAQLIEAHLSRKNHSNEWRASKVNAEYDLYAARGFIARLMSGERPIAVSLCLRHKRDECYLMSSAHDERLTKQSLGKIGLYRLIESLIHDGVRTFHMGGGDFGYKARFGATERALYNVEIARRDELSLATRVELALQAGAKPFDIEKEIDKSLEDLLGSRFETAVGVDFDAILENRQIGTGPQSQRYQATITSVFKTLLETIPPAPGDVFVDVGSGKGKMLYYAAQMGFERCVGIELSGALIPVAERNLRRLGLSATIELLQRDASRLSPEDVAFGTVFYLYNPFSEEVLSKFLATVAKAQAHRKQPIKVVYCNARYPEPFKHHGFSVWREFKRGVAGWRYDDSAIYERS